MNQQTIINVRDIQEALVSLYLRLNGYFTSGFIIHAPQDEAPASNRAEVDILAVRFRHNREPVREVTPSPYLGVTDMYDDLIIGEVKSGKQSPQFNRALLNLENLSSVISWIGTYPPNLVGERAEELLPKMEPKEVNRSDHFIEIQNSNEPRLRAILFHLGRAKPNRNQPKFIGHIEIMNFIWECLRPEIPRVESQTRYDFTLWGPIYEPIIRYFKDPARREHGLPNDVIEYVNSWFYSKMGPEKEEQ